MQIRNLIKESQLPANPKKNMKIAEDFFLKVLTGYIIVAAKEVLKNAQCALGVHDLAQVIVDNYVRVLTTPQGIDTSDEVYMYGSEVITLGLLWDNYHDAVREGDGKRVLLVWKFLLIVFKASRRTNYSKEAVLLLAQYYHFLSPRKAEQLLYSRFINMHGRTGCNILCDLHLEHLNKRLKTVLRNLQSNIQTGSIMRASKSIGILNSVCEKFELETAKKNQTGHHTVPSMKKDLKLITDKLEECPAVLCNTPNRQLKSFHFQHSLLEKVDEEEMASWMVNTVGTHILRCGNSPY